MPRAGVKPPPVVLNLQQTALLLGVSAPTVKALVEQGLPALERGGHGKPWEFDMAAVAAWDRECGPNARRDGQSGVLDPSIEKARKDRAQAELAELELAKRRGRMIDVDDVEKMMTDDYARVRARLLSMPSKLAPLVVTITDPAEADAVLTIEVSEALGELASGGDIADESDGADLSDDSEEARAQGSATTASPHRQRVGRSRAAPIS